MLWRQRQRRTRRAWIRIWAQFSMASLFIAMTLRKWRGRAQVQQGNGGRRTCYWQWKQTPLRTSDTSEMRGISRSVLSFLRSEQARKKLPRVTTPYLPYGKHWSAMVTEHGNWPRLQCDVRADERW